MIEDLPLMNGLTERPEMGLLFDTPAGRIAESFAAGKVAPAMVLDFYRHSLPQLGWRPADGQINRQTGAGKVRFIRDNETLEIDFPQTSPQTPPVTPDETLIRFRLTPRAEK